MEAARRLFGRRIGYARSTYDTLRDADGLLIATEWNEFRRPDFDRMRRLMRAPVIFDGRNVFTPALMRQHGFTYHSIGRP
jgi:UDPglucose 6-dehydrogenase